MDIVSTNVTIIASVNSDGNQVSYKVIDIFSFQFD